MGGVIQQLGVPLPPPHISPAQWDNHYDINGQPHWVGAPRPIGDSNLLAPPPAIMPAQWNNDFDLNAPIWTGKPVGVGQGFLTTDPWAALDGRLAAPSVAAGPQLPTMLNSYGSTGARNKGLISGKQFQPPWSVAGVDYPVGINDSYTQSGGANFPLKVPGVVAMPSGATLTTTATGSINGVIAIGAGATVVFDGWNLSAYTFTGSGTPTLTFTNCQFGSFPAAVTTINSTLFTFNVNLTVKYCYWTGGGLAFNPFIICLGVSSTHSEVWQYNYFYLMPADCWAGLGGGTMDCRFNVFNQICCNGPKTSGILGEHMNCMGFNSNGTWSSIVVDFNVWTQQLQCQGGELVQLYDNFTGTVTNLSFQHNCMIAANSYYPWTMTTPVARTNSHTYSAGDIVTVADVSNTVFFCTVGGVSAASEPAGYASTANNFTFADGACIFLKQQEPFPGSVLAASYLIDSSGGFQGNLTYGTATCSNNFMDASGSFSFGSYPYYANQMATGITVSNNTNLLTGTAFAAPSFV